MGLTRREFLTKLATIAIIAPIAPKLLEAITPTETINSLTEQYVVPALADNVFKPSPLTFAMLERAHQELTFGYDEPDMIMMAPDTYAEFITKWNELPQAARFMRKDGEIELPYFNGASVMPNKHLPKSSWLELNSHSNNPRMSGMFCKHDPTYHPIPDKL